MLLQAAQKIGAGLSTFGLAGAGVGIGVIFASLISLLLASPHADGTGTVSYTHLTLPTNREV